MPYANSKGPDQPAHPRSLICAFVVRCLDSIIPLPAIAEISRPLLISSAEQAGLSFNWSQTPKTGFLVTWLNNTRNDPIYWDRQEQSGLGLHCLPRYDRLNRQILRTNY